MYIPAIGALLGAPLFFLVIATSNFYGSMFFLFLECKLEEPERKPSLTCQQ